ncbi:MAG: response regulator transcription factor [Actinomycetota bacterium]|nr:response regulator transcription factor [Actinomycetota bacterium]
MSAVASNVAMKWSMDIRPGSRGRRVGDPERNNGGETGAQRLAPLGFSGRPGKVGCPPVVARVLLVEDHSVFRQLFASAFDREDDLRVVAQAGTLAEARTMLGENIDVAVVDLNLPDGDGTDLIAQLRQENPHGAVLVLTASLDPALYARAVGAGAAGVVHKSASVSEVMDAVRRLAAGEVLLSQEEVVGLLRVLDAERSRGREAEACFERLAPREREVLLALAEGMNDKQIAQRLNVGVGTARGYVKGMLQKLGVHSRLQALVYAARYGFVEIGPGSPR